MIHKSTAIAVINQLVTDMKKEVSTADPASSLYKDDYRLETRLITAARISHQVSLIPDLPKPYLTEAEVVEAVRQATVNTSQKDFGIRHDLASSETTNILNGKRRISRSIANRLGYQIAYIPPTPSTPSTPSKAPSHTQTRRPTQYTNPGILLSAPTDSTISHPEKSEK